MRKATEDGLSIILTVAAVVIAVVVVWRQVVATPARATTDDGGPGRPEFYADWAGLIPNGIVIGDTAAPIKIVEFADLECPFCRQFHLTTLREVKEEFGAKIAVVFVHLPLTMHRFAKVAAQAAECAEQQGRFVAFVDAVFDKQDSIGLKSWVSYGRAAQVPDSIRYIRCLDSSAMFPRIDSGLTMAERAGVSATPTVFVNGWRFLRPPSSQELSRVITDLLAGSEPFSEQR